MRRFGKAVALLLTVALLTTGAVAWASEELYEGYRVVRVLVNGKVVQSPVPAINFKGSTLIPLRAVTEALGASLQWDGATSTASISLSQPTASQTPTANSETEQLKAQLTTATTELQGLKTELQKKQAETQSLQTKLKEAEASLDVANKKLNPPVSEVGQSRSNPMPTGQAHTASLQVSGLNFTARFTAQEVIRGQAAWTKILAANQFNDPPGADEEYILVRIKYELLAIDDLEAAVDFSEYWFTVVSAAGKDYQRASVVEPKPAFGTKLYKGASDEGWLAVKVDKNDQAPVLTFARDSQGRQGHWLALKPTATSASTPSGQTATTSQPAVSPPAPATSISLSSVKTPEILATYLAQQHGTVLTPLGPMKITYEVTYNDRTFFGFDYWIRMRFEPSSFFLDLSTKNNISAADKQASISRLREHAKTVYDVATGVFPNKKITGQYYDSWYKYPTLQVGFEARNYLTWQNYDDNLLGSGDPYSNATLTTFHFEPRWDDTKF